MNARGVSCQKKAATDMSRIELMSHKTAQCVQRPPITQILDNRPSSSVRFCCDFLLCFVAEWPSEVGDEAPPLVRGPMVLRHVFVVAKMASECELTRPRFVDRWGTQYAASWQHGGACGSLGRRACAQTLQQMIPTTKTSGLCVECRVIHTVGLVPLWSPSDICSLCSMVAFLHLQVLVAELKLVSRAKGIATCRTTCIVLERISNKVVSI